MEEIITGDRFGGWSVNVNTWVKRSGWDSIIRYEDLIKDPLKIVGGALTRLGVEFEMNGAVPPSFQNLHETVPWFFRRGQPGAWSEEMPPHLEKLFMDRHGETLLRLGYSAQSQL